MFKIVIDKDKCIGCGACVLRCPAHSLDILDGGAVWDDSGCLECGACLEMCTREAIRQG